ncbi:MAG: glycerol-3-phosphate dehydrogenase, partial [Sphingomonadales bacterium]|nr:glycerol-3-phosphate dehydrogenase [Sphingomonadales bacterium]
YGGKITTYRHLAEEAVDILAARLPALSGPAWTRTRPLPGGDFPVDGGAAMQRDLMRAHPFLSETEAARIQQAYGTRAEVWLGEARRREDLGRDFGAGLSEAEVDYLCQYEWAVTADDVLWRRSKLGLRMNAAEVAVLADYLARPRPVM